VVTDASKEARSNCSAGLRILQNEQRRQAEYPAARRGQNGEDSSFEGIAALPVLAFGRCDGQAHFLADRTR
jgi:hypothetical protein